MNFIERWAVRRITWMKPLDDLSIDELFKLQHDVGMELAKKLEVRGWERKMMGEQDVNKE